jgi:lysophospholipase L1-like esterase
MPFIRYVLFSACLACVSGNIFAQTKWVATWATSPEPLVSSQSGFNPPSIGLAGNSVRQVLRVSIGGDTLRMRFTNEYTNTAVKINAVTLAVSAGAGIIDTTTTRYFKFGGNDSVTLGANAYAWSDPLAFPLTPGLKVEVTLHFGAGVPAPGTYPGVTVHRGSRTVPRVLAGNQVAARTFAGFVTTSQGQGSWVISSMEVRAPQSAGAVAILGNSITDGFGVTNDAFTRWTDAFTTNLLAHARTRQVGVLNGGIGAGNLVSGGVSTAGLLRYKRDLFDHAGVKWVILFIGVNDIGNTGCSMTTSDNVIAAYATIADSAHARGIKVYGATITPFNPNGYYSENSEACRQRINAWVRTTAIASGKYDAMIDFDKIIRNPADTSRILTTYNNDGLHPNIAGYAFMGNSIDTNLFIDAGTRVKGAVASKGYALSRIEFNGARGGLNVRFQISREGLVSLTVHSLQGKQVAALSGQTFQAGEHVVSLGNAKPKGGTYLVTMRVGAFSVTRKIIL